MKEFWNIRYAENDFAYGCEPNVFLKENISKITKGKILFPAEGEGRNAVYAAQIGYEVDAFDISNEGQKKAIQLAEKRNVLIEYKVGILDNLDYQKESFDGLVLVYAHIPSDRKEFHNKLLSLLKPSGTILFEAFSKEQLNYQSGGPKDIKMLFSEDEIKEEFPNVDFELLTTQIINLDEGNYHQGKGSVIRFIGRKLS